MLKSVKNDTLVSFLLQKSSLTETQLDTILLARTKNSLRIKAASRDGHGVSEGAFMRTLRQGQNNVENCLFTIILLNYLGLLTAKELEKFVGISALISEIKHSPPEPATIERLINTLEQVAMNFSRRKKVYSVT